LLLTDANRQVAAGAGFAAVLDRLAVTPAAATATLATLAGEARAAMLAAPVPDTVARAVIAGYQRLGPDVPVAVRSSATAEDLPHASPRWSEDPRHIFGVLANDLRLEEPSLAPDALFARGATEATAMIDTLTARARRRGRLRGRVVRFALGRARALAGRASCRSST
jgi:pyruvate,water dikinase